MAQSKHVILMVLSNLGKDFWVARIRLTTFYSYKHMADSYFLWEAQFGTHSSPMLKFSNSK